MRRKKRTHEQDTKEALAALRSAVQRTAVVLGPTTAAEWLDHYHSLLEQRGAFRLVATEMHVEYKEKHDIHIG